VNLNKQQGFTLIELVMVIVILGILGATALPKFANMAVEARVSALQGVNAAMQSAINIAHAQALLKNQVGDSGAIELEGKKVSLAFGYPTADKDGIANAITLTGDISWLKDATGVNVGFTTGVAKSETCQITYTAARDASTPAFATINVSGCS